MQKITPFLWFDNQAEEAMDFYTSVFENTEKGKVTRYPKGGPAPEGTVMIAEFTLEGQPFIALNGGPHFKFTEAISFTINCKDQAETDHFWNRLCEGGTPSRCGWLKDKFGLSWQVVPSRLPQLMGSGDAARSQRVMQAMMKMDKIIISDLEAAYEGNQAQ